MNTTSNPEIIKILKIILQIIPVMIFSYSGQIFLKKGVSILSGFTIKEQLFLQLVKLINVNFILGIGLSGIGMIFYLFALSKNDFTLVFPILGAVGFLILPFIGKFALHEDISPVRILGTVIIAIGMLIVARSN